MHLTALPMRPTMASHLRFLEQGSERHRILYCNVAGRVPRVVRQQRFDLVLLHYSVLAARWTPRFARVRGSLEWLRPMTPSSSRCPRTSTTTRTCSTTGWWSSRAGLVYSIFGGAERDAL